MVRIVVTDHSFGGLVHERAMAERHGLELEEFQCASASDAADAVVGATIVFNNLVPLDETALSRMAPRALVVRYGVGVDNVDLRAASRCGATVCNVPDYGATAVADHAAAFLLALARRLPAFNEGVGEGRWGATSMVPSLPDLSEMVLGFLGFGRIAQELAKRMAVFGCEMIASDPFAERGRADALNVTLVDFDSLLERSNALSLHAPLTAETRHIINAAAIDRLPEGAIIVNTSRGGLVLESALVAALRSGKLAGAALDVFEEEPPSGAAALRSTSNLLLSPHAAFYSNRSLDNLQRLAAEEADRFLRGEPLRCPLDLKAAE